MKSKRILVMDDDEQTRDILEAGLTQSGYEVITTDSAEKAISVCKSDPPDLAILDVYLPGVSGIEAAIAIKRESPTPFLFLSASDEKDIVQQAISAGALGYLVKPIDIFQLVPSVEAALVRANDMKILHQAQEQLSNALTEGRATSIAVGLIMERFRNSEEDAFNLLRNQARANDKKIADIAEDIIAAADTLNIQLMKNTL